MMCESHCQKEAENLMVREWNHGLTKNPYCPRTVGIPYFVSTQDCSIDQTTILVNPT